MGETRSKAYIMPLEDQFVQLTIIYLFQPVCLSLLSGWKWSVWFSFEVPAEVIRPICSEELHSLMDAHGICY